MPANESLDKFECRNCGCKQSKVRNTVVIERKFRGRDMTIIKRHRICRRCGLPYVTVEHKYEDQVAHEIPKYAALRETYDAGRHIGALEVINGLLKASEEITAAPHPNDPPPGSPAEVVGAIANALSSSSTKLPPERLRPQSDNSGNRPPKPKRKKRT